MTKKRRIPYQPAQSSSMIDGMFDMLATIFRAQKELMEELHPIELKNGSYVNPLLDHQLQDRTTQLRLQELFGHTVRELAEAMGELPASKTWKSNPGLANGEKFTEEMADALHFFVEMCITAGISAQQLFETYFRMWDKNYERQASGY